MTEQIWNLDSEMETIKKEAIENLKLKKNISWNEIFTRWT